MEINIKNAFLIVVRITWSCCNYSFENVTLSLLTALEMMIYFLLENPIITTLFVSIFTLLLLIVLSISFVILAGVYCLIAIIILCEGIICLACILVVGIALCCLLITMANIHGMHIWLNKLLKLETKKTTE